jgi:hypothetical protein
VRGNTVNLADPSGRIAPLLGLVAGAFLGGVANDMAFGGGQRTADLINSIQNRCISGILNNAWALTQPGLEALAKMGIGAIEGLATAVTGFADLAGFLMGRDDWSSAAVHRAIASTIGVADAYDQLQFDASYQAGKTVGSAVVIAYGIASLAKGIGAFLDELDDLARNFGAAISGFGGGGGGVGVASRSATAAAVAGRSGGVNPWAITGGVGTLFSFRDGGDAPSSIPRRPNMREGNYGVASNFDSLNGFGVSEADDFLRSLNPEKIKVGNNYTEYRWSDGSHVFIGQKDGIIYLDRLPWVDPATNVRPKGFRITPDGDLARPHSFNVEILKP